MNAAEFDFAKLIWPIEPATFFRETWEKEPLIVSRNHFDYYTSLFSTRDVSQMIHFTRPRFAGMRSHSTPTEALRGVAPDQEKLYAGRDDDLAELNREFAEGKTYLVHGLEKRWQPISRLCRTLEATFHHPVNAAMFLTPKGSQGFEAHYDAIEGFILQIDGSKSWRIYKPEQRLPLAIAAAPTLEGPLGEPLMEIELHAGDLLYLPRGYIHEAFTSECSSLHVTVAVAVLRWADLLGSALTLVAAQDVRFREAVPVGFLNTSGAALQERLQELLHLLAAKARANEAVDHLAEQFIGKLPALPGGQFVPPEEIEQIDLDTVLEKAPGVISRVNMEKGSVSIQYPGNRIRGPRQIAPALRFIAAETRFAVRSLPDSLTSQSKLVLVRRLVREGLLAIASRPLLQERTATPAEDIA
jgi:ribosomal protein L16 Arg81 hydroxylase